MYERNDPRRARLNDWLKFNKTSKFAKDLNSIHPTLKKGDQRREEPKPIGDRLYWLEAKYLDVGDKTTKLEAID